VPTETRGYLPKLIAVKNIISNPARYGLQLADVPNEPYFETIVVKQHIDLKIAAKLAELSLDEFKFLNPGHNKPVIRAGEAERIVLPKHKVATFLANFAKHDTPLLSWQAVTLRAGEKAEKVAAQHGMTLAELKRLNGLGNQKKILIGQPLLVPLKGGGADTHLPDLPATPVALPKAIEAAKQAAASRRYVKQPRGNGAVHKAVQRGATRKAGRQPVRQLRAENGKRVKVVASKAPASKKNTIVRAAQRPKFASR
jgi:membrane-bound lytic murein transglycosylase D